MSVDKRDNKYGAYRYTHFKTDHYLDEEWAKASPQSSAKPHKGPAEENYRNFSNLMRKKGPEIIGDVAKMRYEDKKSWEETAEAISKKYKNKVAPADLAFIYFEHHTKDINWKDIIKPEHPEHVGKMDTSAPPRPVKAKAASAKDKRKRELADEKAKDLQAFQQRDAEWEKQKEHYRRLFHERHGDSNDE